MLLALAALAYLAFLGFAYCLARAAHNADTGKLS